MKLTQILCAVTASAVIACSSQGDRSTLALRIPELTAPVNDFAHIIDSESALKIDQEARSLQRSTGDVIVVATVETIRPSRDIHDYALTMFKNHGKGIGKKGKDNGILVLVAEKDGLVRIATGLAMERIVPDKTCEQISKEAAGLFSARKFGEGLLQIESRLRGIILTARGK
jgi:uncharacterized membrane protein YgcG